MIQIHHAALIAALFVLPATSFAAEGVDPDAAAQSGVHKEAGKDINVDADANANVKAGAKTQAEIDADAETKVGNDKPQHQNQSQ